MSGQPAAWPGAPSAEQLRELVEHWHTLATLPDDVPSRELALALMPANVTPRQFLALRDSVFWTAEQADQFRREARAFAEVFARGLHPARARRFRGDVRTEVRCKRRGHELAVVYPSSVAPVLVRWTACRPKSLRWLLMALDADPWFHDESPIRFETALLDGSRLDAEHVLVCRCGVSRIDGATLAASRRTVIVGRVPRASARRTAQIW